MPKMAKDIGRLKKSCNSWGETAHIQGAHGSFLLREGEGVGSLFPMCSHEIFNKFPICSNQVPNVFPIVPEFLLYPWPKFYSCNNLNKQPPKGGDYNISILGLSKAW